MWPAAFRSGFSQGLLTSLWGSSIGPRVPPTALCLVPRRRVVSERVTQYYVLGLARFARSTARALAYFWKVFQ